MLILQAGVALVKTFFSKLNPFNYITTSSQLNRQFEDFMDVQYDLARHDRRFYPFTEVNPFTPWYTKWRIAMFGETTAESFDRLRHKHYAYRVLEALAVTNNEFTSVGGATPAVNLGIGVKTPTFNFVEALHTLNTESKFSNLTPTPKLLPIIPIVDLPELSEWKNHIKGEANFVSTSDFTLEDLEVFNRYAALKEELLD